MADTQAGWYNDGTGTMRWWDGRVWTDKVQPPAPAPSSPGALVDRIAAEAVAGGQPRPAAQGASYVVLQVVLKEKFLGNGSGNLTELERAINAQASMGYRLHTITTASSGSTGFSGGDRVQATMVFEKLT